MYLFNSEKPHQGWVNKICIVLYCRHHELKMDTDFLHTVSSQFHFKTFGLENCNFNHCVTQQLKS